MRPRATRRERARTARDTGRDRSRQDFRGHGADDQDAAHGRDGLVGTRSVRHCLKARMLAPALLRGPPACRPLRGTVTNPQGSAARQRSKRRFLTGKGKRLERCRQPSFQAQSPADTPFFARPTQLILPPPPRRIVNQASLTPTRHL